MPSLQGDIIGRISRLPLRPNEKNALLPLMEAISNSVHSITDRFDEEANKKGRIRVRILREPADSKELGAIVGFEVEDNGTGFDEANYRSFCTPDSRLKERRGGKGVGRLGWLKVFKEIEVQRTHLTGNILENRDFRFLLAEQDQVVELSVLRPAREQKTVIKFSHFDITYRNKCPIKAGVIETKIAAHFVPLFLAGNAPRVTVIDQVETDIEELFANKVVGEQTTEEVLVIGGEAVNLKIWSLKCDKSVRFDPPSYNHAFIAGDSRSVIDYSLDEQLGLKSLDGNHVYIACASSPYLDQKINSERTAFTLDQSEIDDIKRAIARCARAFLAEYIAEQLKRKADVTRSVIQENPQFLFIFDELKDFVQTLQPNVIKKEDIFLELARTRFRRQKKFSSLEEAIKKRPAIDEDVRKKVK